MKKSLSSLSSRETALDRTKEAWREIGYGEGMTAGELKTIVRIKKEIKKYIKKHKELKGNEDDLINIILGVKL